MSNVLTETKGASKEFKKLKKQAEGIVAVIAKKRDELRALLSDIEAIVESVDTAETEIDTGLRTLQDGIDTLSQYL